MKKEKQKSISLKVKELTKEANAIVKQNAKSTKRLDKINAIVAKLQAKLSNQLKNGVEQFPPLFNSYIGCMIENRNNKLYLLVDHHKYLQPIKEAKRKFILNYSGKIPGNEIVQNIYYLYYEIQTNQRST